MNKAKQIKDTQEINAELVSLNQQFQSFYNKMLAIAMDYKSYMDPKASDDFIYEIMNGIIYRLHCAKFHFELLLGIIIDTDDRLTEIHRKSISKQDILGPEFLFDESVKQVSYLSDSIFFHLVSGFDYIS